MTAGHDDQSGMVVVWLELNGAPLGPAKVVDPQDRAAVSQLIDHMQRLLPPQSESDGVHYLALKTYALLALTSDLSAPPRRSAPLWLSVALCLLVGLALVYLASITGLR